MRETGPGVGRRSGRFMDGFDPNWITAAATVSMAVCTVANVLVAKYMSKQMRGQNQFLERQWEKTLEPEVVVYLAPAPTQGCHLDIVIKNIGRGAALDITFESESPQLDPSRNTYLGRMLARGIRSLAPGEWRRVAFESFPSLESYQRNSGVTSMKCRYESTAGVKFEVVAQLDCSGYDESRLGFNALRAIGQMEGRS